KVGDHYDLKRLKVDLSEMGYQAVNKVDHSLQFASRGDILDIYSVSYLHPIRIEFFDDEIESIRVFDIQTQESLSTVDECLILPATDLLLSDEEITAFAEKASHLLKKEATTLRLRDPKLAQEMESNVALAMEEIVGRSHRAELYKYFGMAVSKPQNILSYFRPEFTYVTHRPSFVDACERLTLEADNYYGELRYAGKALPGLRAYMHWDAALDEGKPVYRGEPFSTSPEDFVFQVHRITLTGTNLSSIVPSIQSYLTPGNKVVVCLPEIRQRDTVEALLREAGIAFEAVKGFELPEGNLGLSEVALSEGFEIPSLKIAYISSGELFRHKAMASRFTSRFKNATILRSYEDLKPGDYVVHEYNGIGQFMDIQTIETGGIHRDYLHIAYAGNQFLYVPLEQFRLVRKYAGREGVAPKLSSLSGHDWDKRKERIRKRINELADRLVSLYGDRAKMEGYAFPPDDEFQKPFEDEFPFPLTPDQTAAINAIKADMEKPEIMDRLLCGDVGFGKTEVAFRAAFKAISAGKQVALLCPTTLLARQHMEVALERFRPFGVRMALFSRLVPESTQKTGMKALAEGKIDLAIGTHRLLSKDFVFKDLGLLIVDEEQRFGVEQKERI
ncbi:MAG: DEAD/DEAH box helicase, partial [Bacilli bacterium]|nr:DEAD/DEAH box helicase [Bacilli bacterium]